MNRRHLIIAVVVAVIAAILAFTIFGANNQTPPADGAATANSAEEQLSLPAGPASEPAETTGNQP